MRRFAQEFPDYRVVFSAEPFCWPDKSLAPKYPIVTFGERYFSQEVLIDTVFSYLNSGMFMGYAPEILEILDLGKDLKDSDDDQRFYTNIYLDPTLRVTP